MKAKLLIFLAALIVLAVVIAGLTVWLLHSGFRPEAGENR